MRDLCLALLVLMASGVSARGWEPPAPSVFTYQGVLEESGNPVNRKVDIEVRLWDAISGGSAASVPVLYMDMLVMDGLFTISPNFGSAVWTGESRWLEIKVDGVTLSPRQAVTYAPQAMQARGTFYNESQGFLGVGRSSQLTGSEVFGVHRESAGFGGMYVSTAAGGLPFYGYSATGSPVAYHYYNASGQEWVLQTPSQALVFRSTGDLTVPRRVGIGTTDPDYPLHVRGGTAANSALVTNEASNGSAVSGLSVGSSGYGVFGLSSGTFGRGVKGVTESSNGVGVEGEATVAGGAAMFARATTPGTLGLLVQATAAGSIAADFNGFVAVETDLSVGTNARQNRLLVRGSLNTTATPTGHVALIENITTGTSPDVLALRVNSSDATPSAAVNYITFFNAANASLGAIQGNDLGGVELAGPGNDYAEWLEQESEGEVFEPGDVVAVRGGKISLDTRGADQTMVVSTSPIVTGNRPMEDDDGVPGWQKIAFVGQAPVRVIGPVNAGDFLLPSGLGDGTAVAVSAGRIDPERLTQVLGVAWEGSQELGVKRVKAAIGVDQADANAHVIRAQHERLRELSERVERLERLMERLSPGAP